MPSAFRLLAAAALLALAGCAMQPSHDDTAWAPTLPEQPQVAAAPADGAIYHDAQGMELFADPRAHRAGDILTIVLVESTQASKKASTSTSKTDKADIAAPTILGRACRSAARVRTSVWTAIAASTAAVRPASPTSSPARSR